jgi:hypothetical protein
MEYHKCLQWFKTENDHKDLLKQQRFGFIVKHFKEFGFIVKHFKEFDMANARKIEAIKWDWNLLWHIVNNDKCLLATKRLELP